MTFDPGTADDARMMLEERAPTLIKDDAVTLMWLAALLVPYGVISYTTPYR